MFTKVIQMLTAPTIAQASEDFLNARRAERLSENTLASYRNGLTKFTRHVGDGVLVTALSAADVRNFMAAQNSVSDQTLVRYHTALSALWTWLVSERITSDHIVRQVRPPEPEEHEILPFTKDELVKLLMATDRSKPYRRKGQRQCDHATLAGDRDRAVIYLLLDTGMRVSELTGLRISDLQENGALVFGKGKKQRWVPMSPTTRDFLAIYLDKRQNLTPDSRIFPVQRHAIDDLLKRLQDRSGVTNVHAHRFRHTFAITYLRNGGDPYTLQKILGHSSLEMVKKYLAIARTDIERAHQRFSPVTNMGL